MGKVTDFDKTVSRIGSGSLRWDGVTSSAAANLPLLSLGVADMDFPTAPVIRTALAERMVNGIFGYSTEPDVWREDIANWWQRRHGVTISAEQTALAGGTIPAFSCMLRTVSAPGDKVVLLTPVYGVFFNCIRNNGRRVVSVPLLQNEESVMIDFAALEAAFAQADVTTLIWCQPHNPTGNIWSISTQLRVLALARQYKIAIISDEAHADLQVFLPERRPDAAYVPLVTLASCEDRVFTLFSPSKAFNIAGLQVAAVVAPDAESAKRAAAALNRDEVAELNFFAGTALHAALSAEGEKWLNDLQGYLSENRRYLAEAVRNIPGLRLRSAQATYLAWLDIRAWQNKSESLEDLSPRVCADLQQRYNLHISCGNDFGSGGEGYLRLNMACSRSVLQEAVRRLAALAAEYRRFDVGD